MCEVTTRGMGIFRNLAWPWRGRFDERYRRSLFIARLVLPINPAALGKASLALETLTGVAVASRRSSKAKCQLNGIIINNIKANVTFMSHWRQLKFYFTITWYILLVLKASVRKWRVIERRPATTHLLVIEGLKCGCNFAFLFCKNKGVAMVMYQSVMPIMVMKAILKYMRHGDRGVGMHDIMSWYRPGSIIINVNISLRFYSDN